MLYQLNIASYCRFALILLRQYLKLHNTMNCLLARRSTSWTAYDLTGKIHKSLINAVLFIYLEPDFFIIHDIMVWSPQYLQYFNISCFWSHTFRVKLNCYDTVPFQLDVNQLWVIFLQRPFSPQGSEPDVGQSHTLAIQSRSQADLQGLRQLPAAAYNSTWLLTTWCLSRSIIAAICNKNPMGKQPWSCFSW